MEFGVDTGAPPTSDALAQLDTPTPSATPWPDTPYDYYMPDSADFQASDSGCEWQGMAGQVINAARNAGESARVRIMGSGGLDVTIVPGSNLDYGPGGWEIQLEEESARKTYQVWVEDLDGVELSETYTINYGGECDRNLAVVTFNEIPKQREIPPTETVLPSETPAPTATSEILGRPHSGPQFIVDEDLLHFESFTGGCDWQGIAGEAFNTLGGPVTGLQVRVTGQSGTGTIDQTTETGAASAYGESGWRVRIGQSSRIPQTVTVQLFQADGTALSDPFELSFPGNCGQNLAFMTFRQVQSE
jgi:hypothetical protein